MRQPALLASCRNSGPASCRLVARHWQQWFEQRSLLNSQLRQVLVAVPFYFPCREMMAC